MHNKMIKVCDIDLDAMRSDVIGDEALEVFCWTQREMSLILNSMSEFSVLRKEVARYSVYSDQPDFRQQELRTNLKLLMFSRSRIERNLNVLALRFYQMGLTLKELASPRFIPFGLTVVEISDEEVNYQNEMLDSGVRWHLTRDDVIRFPLMTLEKVDQMIDFFGVQAGINRFVCEIDCQNKVRHIASQQSHLSTHTQKVVSVMKSCGMDASGKNSKKVRTFKKTRNEVDDFPERAYDYSPWIKKDSVTKSDVVIGMIDEINGREQEGEKIVESNIVNYDEVKLNIEDVNLQEKNEGFKVIELIRQDDLKNLSDQFSTYDSEKIFPKNAKNSIESILIAVVNDFGKDIDVDLGYSFTLSQLCEQIIAQQHNWSKTKFTDWLFLLTKTERFKYQGSHFPYLQLLKYISKIGAKVEDYLDFGAGTGYGAMQFKTRLKLDRDHVFVFDIENKLRSDVNHEMTFVDEEEMLKRQYDLITVNNVLHHIGDDFEDRLFLLCDMVASHGTMLIRDHSNFVQGLVNVCIVHKMYDLYRDCHECDAIYFRDCFVIADFVRDRGFYVDLHFDRKSDVNVYTLVCVRTNF